MNIRRLCCRLALCLLFASPAFAQFSLVETGGTFRTDATNLAAAAQGATAIGFDELGTPNNHYIANINDGLYGNYESWIGLNDSISSTASWVGVRFAAPVSIGAFAFGRDNLGAFTDRATVAPYRIEFTTDATVYTDPAAAVWTLVGVIDHAAAGTPQPHLRHLYNLSTAEPLTNVLAFRLLTSSGMTYGNAIDELEVYGSATPIPEPAAVATLLGLAALALGALRRRAWRS